jgi:hypothetical protein
MRITSHNAHPSSRQLSKYWKQMKINCEPALFGKSCGRGTHSWQHAQEVISMINSTQEYLFLFYGIQ